MVSDLSNKLVNLAKLACKVKIASTNILYFSIISNQFGM